MSGSVWEMTDECLVWNGQVECAARGGMAASAEEQGKTNWSVAGDQIVDYGERVRRAFGVYGFGRAREGEPNEHGSLGAKGRDAARNVIAANHKGHSRPIHGYVGKKNASTPPPPVPLQCGSGYCAGQQQCEFDEDFFVLNERVRPGDKIRFRIEVDGAPSAPPRFRVRIFHTEPCEGFRDLEATTGDLDNDGVYGCRQKYQIYPPVEPLEDKDQFTPPGDQTVMLPFGAEGVDPELGELIFIGVTPILSVGCGPYRLSVSLERRAPLPY